MLYYVLKGFVQKKLYNRFPPIYTYRGKKTSGILYLCCECTLQGLPRLVLHIHHPSLSIPDEVCTKYFACFSCYLVCFMAIKITIAIIRPYKIFLGNYSCRILVFAISNYFHLNYSFLHKNDKIQDTYSTHTHTHTHTSKHAHTSTIKKSFGIYTPQKKF